MDKTNNIKGLEIKYRRFPNAAFTGIGHLSAEDKKLRKL